MTEEKTDEGRDVEIVRNVICPGKSDNVFENYVFIPINDTGYIAIKHVLNINGPENKKDPIIQNMLSGIKFSSGNTERIKGALIHLLNI